jgi:hypothetical protein
MKKTFREVLLIALLLGLPGCAASTSSAGPPKPAPSDRPMIQIVNNNVLDANVYVVVGSHTWRLDFVGGFGKDSVRFPLALVPGDNIRVLVDPIGSSEAYLTDPVSYSGDESFRLTIENSLSLSTFYPMVLGERG